MLRYRPLSKAHSIDSLFISLNNMCGIRHYTLNNSSIGSVAGFPVRLLSLRARIKINSSVDYAFVIFSNSQQYVERYTEIRPQ